MLPLFCTLLLCFHPSLIYPFPIGTRLTTLTINIIKIYREKALWWIIMIFKNVKIIKKHFKKLRNFISKFYFISKIFLVEIRTDDQALYIKKSFPSTWVNCVNFVMSLCIIQHTLSHFYSHIVNTSRSSIHYWISIMIKII